MTLTKTNSGAVKLRWLQFSIPSYEFVTVTSYAENDLQHVIGVELRVVLRRHFTDKRDPREKRYDVQSVFLVIIS